MGFPGGAAGKYLLANAGDAGDKGLIPGLGRSSDGGYDNPLQYSCLENPLDKDPGGLQPLGSQRTEATEHSIAF